MAPSPQESTVPVGEQKTSIDRPMTGEEVVISGMSGVFPKSNSTLEFMENLFNKVDMVSEDNARWSFKHPEMPTHLGKIARTEKFDAQFFRVHYKQACAMEPMSRKLLEHAYSAIYDSGVNPLQLRGKKVGVFIGCSSSELEKTVIYENVQRNGFGITGCNKAMYANRISYWIDGKGPSYALDLACSSSMACLGHAYRSISTGQCDAAIIGGCNLCMHPYVTLNYRRAGFLCLDGKTKCFDKNGDGYVRSDAISILFVQKAKDAKRIYSEIYHVKEKYSLNKGEFTPSRESEDIEKFLNDFYSNIDVSPKDVEYVEAFGAAVAETDAKELEAIGNIFGRDKPVKVGCVKSNMGSSEPASGICSVTKVCLAYHKGELPANLHYSDPLDIPSVRDGKVEVLQENARFNRGFTALNSFSYTGANMHILLKGHYKPKDADKYRTSIPHLVLVSGRQEECVNRILNELKNKPVDPEQIGLLHTIHETEVPGHMCRGYSILSTNSNNETVCQSQNVEYYSEMARPIWFVYSGMGSQWAGMGAELMRIPTFSAAIQRCHVALEPKGIDIVRILTQPDKTIYDNILNSFVGIAAVQIGLTDLLKEMGIVPDKIIGHSVGELGCAYADGCFTAEEMILSAYSRGLVSVQTPFIRGSMAAVGLGYKAIIGLCPPEIEVACHNSSESSTISGPADIMKAFVAELVSRGVFAKEVPCSNIAYHSRYIADAGPHLLKRLSEVIKTPKARSEKWVSTSVPQERWEESMAKYSSAEYHTNNLLNSVLFEETAKLIPKNALLIEIAPHGLLQAILKRSHTECAHVPLTRRGHSNPVQFFLEAIAKLYQEGLHPKVATLYPKIEYPVATETPLLSQLVEWEHSDDWPLARYDKKDRVTAAVRKFVMSLHDDDYKYLEGHVRDGVTVFPEAAILVLIWETWAMQQGEDFRKLSIVFRDVQFQGEAHIKAEEPFKLSIMIHKGDSQFEVSHDGVQIASGFISEVKNSEFRQINDEEFDDDDDIEVLTSKDVYKIMGLKGYSYRNKFQSIQSSNVNRKKATVKALDDWVIFLDSLIQFNAFAKDYNGVSGLKLIKKLTINTEEYNKVVQMNRGKLTAYRSDVYGITRCAGVEMDGLVYDLKPIVDGELDVLETRSFLPYFLVGEIDVETALLVNLQIAADNLRQKEIKITEISSNTTNLADIFKKVVDNIPSVNIDVTSVKEFDLNTVRKSNILVVSNVLKDEKKMNYLHSVMSKNAFLLAVEGNTSEVLPLSKHFNAITAMNINERTLILLKKSDVNNQDNVKYIPITNDSTFSWISKLQTELQNSAHVVLVSERQPYCGLIGLFKTLSKEFTKKVSLVITEDHLAPPFNPDNKFYKEQLMKNLTINVLKQGKWGGYYYLPSPKSTYIRNISLSSELPGDIDSVTWIEAPEVPATNKSVKVCYSGLSLQDVHKAVGKVKVDQRNFGMDFSGINNKGEKVMGVIAGGAIASVVEADTDLMWPVPEHWSLEDAATVPLPYVHAYYCLGVKYPIFENRSVFVTGGAGALGQAVISICLATNNTVYTAVSDVKKKEFLLRLFPQLDEKNIACSRQDNFHLMVINNSNMKRCAIVINCLSGPLRESAMKCVGFSGIFIDVSNYDMTENNGFGMNFLYEERNYIALNLSNIFEPKNERERKMVQLMVSEGIAKGTVRPISRVVYSPLDVTRAFRLLASNKNRGRVLISMQDHKTTCQTGLTVYPRMTYSSEGTYVVVCDEYNLGIELVDRLIRRGATKVLIHVKSKSIGGYFRTKLASWTKLNAISKISAEDLQTEVGCVTLLKEGAKLGPVQGIFVVQTCGGQATQNFEKRDFVEKFTDTALVVANLDSVSRNICPELSHFVILTRFSQSPPDEFTTSVCENICQNRFEIGLPALTFKVNEINKTSSVFNTLEISLKLKYNNVVAFNLPKKTSTDFLKRIAKILGTDNIEVIPEHLTLTDLSINELNVEEVKTAIKEEYQINYASEGLKRLTIASLKTLGDRATKNTKFDSGLGAFYTYIDKDECLATEPLVAMPTKLSNATEKEEELNPKDTYLMLLPGFEGHYHIFTKITERLKVQAMSLQLGPDSACENISQIAANIMKFMKKRFELKSKFYLLGYSFGVCVALELAALMEKEGHVGIVFCLDSSPAALRVQLDAYIGKLSDAQLQDTIVQHMYHLMTGKESKELKGDLDLLGNWSDKIECCVNRLRGLVKFSHQYKKSILETAYNRIKLIRDYNPDFVLESEVVLIKGIPHPNAEKLPEDYDLSKYSKQQVKIFNIESDHATAVNDCRVSNIVNRFLEPQVLEEYSKKNLCETYLADPVKIL